MLGATDRTLGQITAQTALVLETRIEKLPSAPSKSRKWRPGGRGHRRSRRETADPAGERARGSPAHAPSHLRCRRLSLQPQARLPPVRQDPTGTKRRGLPGKDPSRASQASLPARRLPDWKIRKAVLSELFSFPAEKVSFFFG